MADSGLEQEMIQDELVHLVVPQSKKVLSKISKPKPTLERGTGVD